MPLSSIGTPSNLLRVQFKKGGSCIIGVALQPREGGNESGEYEVDLLEHGVGEKDATSFWVMSGSEAGGTYVDGIGPLKRNSQWEPMDDLDQPSNLEPDLKMVIYPPARLATSS
jgi:hypothetical protein